MLLNKFFSFFEKLFALILFFFNPRKQSIERNLEKLGYKGYKMKLAYLTYYNLFRSYKMLAAYVFFKKEPGLKIVNEELLRDGRIFVSIHYGPWDIALRLVNNRYPYVSVVGGRDILNWLREKHGLRLLYSSDGMKKVIEVARRERVALMLDRTFYENGTYIKVGNSYMKVSRAAIILARRLREDMNFIWAEIKGDGIVLHVEKIKYAGFKEMLDNVTRLINKLVLEHPEYWFNFFIEWA